MAHGEAVTRRVGLVGSEGAKFTPTTEAKAREMIREILDIEGATEVVSGKCHLGGIDIWSVEEAALLGIPCTEFPLAKHTWEGGYKQRNLQIARYADLVYCLTVKALPPGYAGMRFDYCYHCGTDAHVKSGGCWTTKQARKMGKVGVTLVVPEAVR